MYLNRIFKPSQKQQLTCKSLKKGSKSRWTTVSKSKNRNEKSFPIWTPLADETAISASVAILERQLTCGLSQIRV
jgi:hypothetical protein